MSTPKIILHCGHYLTCVRHTTKQTPTQAPFVVGSLVGTQSYLSSLGRNLVKDCSVPNGSRNVFTNCDQILNGLRISVMNNVCSADDVKIHFWLENADAPIVVEILPSGKINDWPRGFFDQTGDDLMEILTGRMK